MYVYVYIYTILFKCIDVYICRPIFYRPTKKGVAGGVRVGQYRPCKCSYTTNLPELPRLSNATRVCTRQQVRCGGWGGNVHVHVRTLYWLHTTAPFWVRRTLARYVTGTVIGVGWSGVHVHVNTLLTSHNRPVSCTPHHRYGVGGEVKWVGVGQICGRTGHVHAHIHTYIYIYTWEGGTKASIPSTPIFSPGIFHPQTFQHILFTHRLLAHRLFNQILLTDRLFTHKLFTHRLFSHRFFSHRLFTHRFFTHILLAHRILTHRLFTHRHFTHRLVTHRLYTHRLFNHRLFAHSLLPICILLTHVLFTHWLFNHILSPSDISHTDFSPPHTKFTRRLFTSSLFTHRLSTHIQIDIEKLLPKFSALFHLTAPWKVDLGGIDTPPSLFCRMVPYPPKPPSLTPKSPPIWRFWSPWGNYLPPDPLFSLRSQKTTSQLPSWLS